MNCLFGRFWSGKMLGTNLLDELVGDVEELSTVFDE